MLWTKGPKSYSGDWQPEAEISKGTPGEMWLKEHLWDRCRRRWAHKGGTGEELLQTCDHSSNVTDPLLHPRSSPSARVSRSHTVPGAAKCWGPSPGHPVPWGHCWAHTAKEQQGGNGTAKILPFKIYLGFCCCCLYLFLKWGFIFKRSRPVKLSPQVQLCTTATCRSRNPCTSLCPTQNPEYMGLRTSQNTGVWSRNSFSPYLWWMQLLLATARLQSHTTKFQKKSCWKLEKVWRITRITAELEILPQNESK